MKRILEEFINDTFQDEYIEAMFPGTEEFASNTSIKSITTETNHGFTIHDNLKELENYFTKDPDDLPTGILEKEMFKPKANDVGQQRLTKGLR